MRRQYLNRVILFIVGVIIGCTLPILVIMGSNVIPISRPPVDVITPRSGVEIHNLHHIWRLDPELYDEVLQDRWIRVEGKVSRIRDGNAYSDGYYYWSEPPEPVVTVLQGLSDEELKRGKEATWKVGVTCKAGDYDYKSTPPTLYMTDCRDFRVILCAGCWPPPIEPKE